MATLTKEMIEDAARKRVWNAAMRSELFSNLYPVATEIAIRGANDPNGIAAMRRLEDFLTATFAAIDLPTAEQLLNPQ